MAIFPLTALRSIMNHVKHVDLTWNQEITLCPPCGYLPQNSFSQPNVLDFLGKYVLIQEEKANKACDVVSIEMH